MRSCITRTQVLGLNDTDTRLDNLQRYHVRDLLREGDYTFRDCVEHPDVRAHFITKCITQGDPVTGFPIRRTGETVPGQGDMYVCFQSRQFRRWATRPHPELKFMRAAAVNGAVNALKNLCMYAIAIRAVHMPTKQAWDNFATVLYNFWIEYCFREGLSITSDLARQVLLYIFYGTFSWVTKAANNTRVTRSKKVLFFLHRKVRNGRSRFTSEVPANFAKFIALYQKHQWREFIDDKGAGEPPMEYLVAVEEGLRNYHTDVHAMGTHALRSPTHWGEIDLWRKREAYIALGRYLLGFPPDYHQWDCFLFTDYQTRQMLAKTFVERHYPLSNGDDDKNFGGAMDFDWDAHHYAPRAKAKVVVDLTAPAPAATAATASSSSPKKKTCPMEFDVEKGCFVPIK